MAIDTTFAMRSQAGRRVGLHNVPFRTGPIVARVVDGCGTTADVAMAIAQAA